MPQAPKAISEDESKNVYVVRGSHPVPTNKLKSFRTRKNNSKTLLPRIAAYLLGITKLLRVGTKTLAFSSCLHSSAAYNVGLAPVTWWKQELSKRQRNRLGVGGQLGGPAPSGSCCKHDIVQLTLAQDTLHTGPFSLF